MSPNAKIKYVILTAAIIVVLIAVSCAPVSTGPSSATRSAPVATDPPGITRPILVATDLPDTAAAPDLVAPDLLVYSDVLADGWEDWSYGGFTPDYVNTSPVHSGADSVAVTYTAGWSGLQLGYHGEDLDVSAYDTFRFWIHGGSTGGQTIVLRMGDLEQSVTPQANTWIQVDISLLSMGSPRTIKGIDWFSNTDNSQPTFYLDDMAFVDTGAPTPTAPPPAPGPALSVDATAGQHAISPYIYGMNWAEEDLAAELRLPVNRWGGNATSRYNWQTNMTNVGDDWYYESTPFNNADDFVAQNNASGTASLLTVPLIDWVTRPQAPQSHPYDCSFKKADFPNQIAPPGRESYMYGFDEWDQECGSGYRPDPSTGESTSIDGHLVDPLDTSIAITPAFASDWIAHLVSTYGTAANGGVKFYNLDNEPMIWDSTHRDIHPDGVSYDELRDKTYAYASAIKESDPSALTLGPVEWGWCAYFYSGADGGCQNGPDRQAHGDLPWVVWYLQQMQLYEQQHGVRILDYLDLHAYPYDGVGLTGAGDADLQSRRLRSTRSLWDPTFYDEGWVGHNLGESVHLIPRMKQWVNDNYPGTRLAITEYNWGGLEHINGALTEADILGIFGREGLDLATIWDPPAANQPGAYAFRMYLNYDGSGGAFGDTSVQAASTDQERLAIYAALRSEDDAMTLMIINKTSQPLTSQVSLAGFSPTGSAAIYRYSAANLTTIVYEGEQAVTSSGFEATFPANSITLIVIPG